MSSSKGNTKIKGKIRKEFFKNSEITAGSINKFQEKIAFPDNPNEVCLRRTRIYEKTVYRNSEIDNENQKPLPRKKVESENFLQKCELIAEIEKQLKHLQSQQKYLQMAKESKQNQSWGQSLSANQSVKKKKDLSEKECTEKLPSGCDTNTRQVCALLQMLIEKNCVKVTDSSTQIESPIEHKKINGVDYSPSFQTKYVHLSSDTSSVNVLWKGKQNSCTIRRAAVKMVNSSTQVGNSIEGPKHRSTQVSIEIVGSNNKVRNPMGGFKHRLGKKKNLVSSESSKSSPRFRRMEREAASELAGRNSGPESSYKSLENELKPQVKREVKMRNVCTQNSSKSVAVISDTQTLKPMGKEFSLTPRTSRKSSRSPHSYSVGKEFQRSEMLSEKIGAKPRKTVGSGNRESSTNPQASPKISHKIPQSPRNIHNTSEYRNVQTSIKTKSHQLTLSTDFHSSLRNDGQIIVSSTRKTVQTRKASQIAIQSYKDSKHDQRVKKSNDLSRGSSATPQWDSGSVRPNVIDDRTYIVPDTDNSADYIVLPYVHNPNDLESPPSSEYVYTEKRTAKSLASQDELSKNVTENSKVILEDACSRESHTKSLITSQNEIQDIPHRVESIPSFQSNASIPFISKRFSQSIRSHHSKMGSNSFEYESRKLSSSDALVRNRLKQSNLGKMSKELQSESPSISTPSQQHEVSDMSYKEDSIQPSQKNASFESQQFGLKGESIRLKVSYEPHTNTSITPRSNQSHTENGLKDISVSPRSEIKTKFQPSLEVSNTLLENKPLSHRSEIKKNSCKLTSKLEPQINTNFSMHKDMSYELESSHELQKNAPIWEHQINSDLKKHKDISYESDSCHELQKNAPTSTRSLKCKTEDGMAKLEAVGSLEISDNDIFKMVDVKNEKSAIDRKVEDANIFHQIERKELNSKININKSERPSKSDSELKSPSPSKSVYNAYRSPKMTCSESSFTLKPIAQSKIDDDADQCIPPKRDGQNFVYEQNIVKSEIHKGDTGNTEDGVFVESKIEKVLEQTLVNPIVDSYKREISQENESISETGIITEIPAELLIYIQYLQNRLKDCDEMVAKQTYDQGGTSQNNKVFEVETQENCESDSIEGKNTSLRFLAKTEIATEEEFLLVPEQEKLHESLESVSKFELSCCCSCCGEEQSTSYHSDIPPFSGCDCMKEGYYQIMRLAYKK